MRRRDREPVRRKAYNEVKTATSCTKHFILASIPDAKVSWAGVNLKDATSTWNNWTSGASQSATAGPYTSVWQNNYYAFTAERTGAATC